MGQGELTRVCTIQFECAVTRCETACKRTQREEYARSAETKVRFPLWNHVRYSIPTKLSNDRNGSVAAILSQTRRLAACGQ